MKKNNFCVVRDGSLKQMTDGINGSPCMAAPLGTSSFLIQRLCFANSSTWDHLIGDIGDSLVFSVLTKYMFTPGFAFKIKIQYNISNRLLLVLSSFEV